MRPRGTDGKGPETPTGPETAEFAGEGVSARHVDPRGGDGPGESPSVVSPSRWASTPAGGARGKLVWPAHELSWDSMP